MTALRSPSPSRLVAASALALSVLALGVVLLASGSDYRLHLRFADAGQLVEGGRVQVAGRKVGSIESIRLTRAGQADVEVSITDDAVLPLREGTRAAIRAVGQAGIANRYVALSPGPVRASELDSGAVLDTTQTDGIVNLDALLNSFGPKERRNLERLIARSADIYAGSSAPTFRSALGKFAPALAEFERLYGDVARDRSSLKRLVGSAATATTAIASRRRDLVAAIEHSGEVFSALADQRAALVDILERAPGVLRQATGTLGRTRSAVTALRPTLAAIPPAARPLDELLGRLQAFLPVARPVVDELVALMPDVDATLDGLRPLADPAVDALRATGAAMRDSKHIFEGLRYYGSDLVLGALVSVGGLSTGYYDARGHYAKVNFVQNAQTVLSGKLANLLTGNPLAPGLLDARTGLNRRCPGGDAPPAPDGSNPWDLGPALCTADHNMPASVNTP